MPYLDPFSWLEWGALGQGVPRRVLFCLGYSGKLMSVTAVDAQGGAVLGQVHFRGMDEWEEVPVRVEWDGWNVNVQSNGLFQDYVYRFRVTLDGGGRVRFDFLGFIRKLVIHDMQAHRSRGLFGGSDGRILLACGFEFLIYERDTVDVDASGQPIERPEFGVYAWDFGWIVPPDSEVTAAFGATEDTDRFLLAGDFNAANVRSEWAAFQTEGTGPGEPKTERAQLVALDITQVNVGSETFPVWEDVGRVLASAEDESLEGIRQMDVLGLDSIWCRQDGMIRAVNGSAPWSPALGPGDITSWVLYEPGPGELLVDMAATTPEGEQQDSARVTVVKREDGAVEARRVETGETVVPDMYAPSFARGRAGLLAAVPQLESGVKPDMHAVLVRQKQTGLGRVGLSSFNPRGQSVEPVVPGEFISVCADWVRGGGDGLQDFSGIRVQT